MKRIVGLLLLSSAACDGELRLGPAEVDASVDAGDQQTEGGPLDGAPKPPADTAFGACTSDVECVLESLRCDVGRSACVECRSDADCNTGDRRRCDLAIARCVECRNDGECDATKRCELTTLRCVERCSASKPCSVGTCDASTGRCIECTTVGAACAGGAVCAPTSVCVPCLADAQCSGDTPRCDTALARCVECTANAECGAGARCDPRAGKCKEP